MAGALPLATAYSDWGNASTADSENENRKTGVGPGGFVIPTVANGRPPAIGHPHLNDGRASPPFYVLRFTFYASPFPRLLACARNSHLVDQQRAGADVVASVNVGARGTQVAQHVAQVTGDGHFLDRPGRFAIFDPEAGGTA